jgi:F-type H+-transporting ATPase subunit a
LARDSIGEEYKKYVPWLLSLFFFLLINNLFGLFPFTVVPHHRTDGLSVATGNLAVTGALAFIVFVVVLAAGMRKHGFGGYWKTLVPPGVPWPLVPIIFLLECIGLLTRAFALAIRLFANMLAGHALLGILFSFVVGIYVFAHPWQSIMPTIGSMIFLIGIFLFEVLIALIQAYIFTILSVIFVSISVAEEH